MTDEKKIIIRQTRSIAGRSKRIKETIKALGLGSIGAQREYSVNPALLGMVRKVEHLVKVYTVN